MPPGLEDRNQLLEQARLGSVGLCTQTLFTTMEGAGSVASFLQADPLPPDPCKAEKNRGKIMLPEERH